MTRATKTGTEARRRLLRLMWELISDEADLTSEIRHRIPEAWHLLAHDTDVSAPKQKITLRLDKAVVQFFRALGEGYQSRINRVLATYVAMQVGRMDRADLALDSEIREFLERSGGASDGDEPG